MSFFQQIYRDAHAVPRVDSTELGFPTEVDTQIEHTPLSTSEPAPTRKVTQSIVQHRISESETEQTILRPILWRPKNQWIAPQKL